MRVALKAVVLAGLLMPIASIAEARSGSRPVLIFLPETEYRLQAGESPSQYRERVRADARSICAPGPRSLDAKASRVCEARVVERAEAGLRVRTASR